MSVQLHQTDVFRSLSLPTAVQILLRQRFIDRLQDRLLGWVKPFLTFLMSLMDCKRSRTNSRFPSAHLHRLRCTSATVGWCGEIIYYYLVMTSSFTFAYLLTTIPTGLLGHSVRWFSIRSHRDVSQSLLHYGGFPVLNLVMFHPVRKTLRRCFHQFFAVRFHCKH